MLTGTSGRSAPKRFAVIACGCALLSGCGSDSSSPGQKGEPDPAAYVEDYCAYGAVSQAQLDGCIDHVTPQTVDDYDTNAAEYARGELEECLGDAGPFCEGR